MKLVIQIPCLNEAEDLPSTFADLPRHVDGIDAIEVLIIDDGSTDGTADVARRLGAHHIVRFASNRGLAAAHQAGLDAALRLGADVVVNTDADNQYPGREIARLVAPIVQGRANLVVGDRQTDKLAHFSLVKRALQRWGSRLVRRASGTPVVDSTSGFRALDRKAMGAMFVHNRFTYTLETVIQAGNLGLVIVNVPIEVNPNTRPSRLFKSIPEYLRKNGPVIFRSYAMYWPVQTFGFVAVALLGLGLTLGLRFGWFFLTGDGDGHVQSLLVGVGAVVLSFVVALMAFLGELMATNRRLAEEILQRVRRLDAAVSQLNPGLSGIEGVERTDAAPWRSGTGGARSPAE